MSKIRETGRINISSFFGWLKGKCKSEEYNRLNITVIDFIISYIRINDYSDDEVLVLVEEIQENKMVYEFIEVECRSKRVLVEHDYKNNTELNKLNKVKKTNLMKLFNKRG